MVLLSLYTREQLPIWAYMLVFGVVGEKVRYLPQITVSVKRYVNIWARIPVWEERSFMVASWWSPRRLKSVCWLIQISATATFYWNIHRNGLHCVLLNTAKQRWLAAAAELKLLSAGVRYSLIYSFRLQWSQVHKRGPVECISAVSLLSNLKIWIRHHVTEFLTVKSRDERVGTERSCTVCSYGCCKTG